ncbi:Histidine kinase [Pseudomonas sp. GM74]|nr:Histidine kinase [Pseudomonas sp. GM74]
MLRLIIGGAWYARETVGSPYSELLSVMGVAPTANLQISVELQVKIWRTDGTVIYGTNRAITDRKFPLDEITEALKGNVVTDLKDLDEDENEFERKLNVPLYEIYAPLRDSRTGDIIPVGEFYEKADSLKREISRVRQQVWADVGTATLAMLTLLFFIVRRSDKIIQQQQQQVALRLRLQEQTRLHISNAELQHKMATATQEFSRVNELTLRRIGADLHDGPAQLLTLILIRLDDLAENCSAVDQESLETIRGAATDALNEVRSADTFQHIPARAGIQCQKGVIFGMPFSSSLMRRDRVELGIPRVSAARLKLRAFTTSTNSAISLRYSKALSH